MAFKLVSSEYKNGSYELISNNLDTLHQYGIDNMKLNFETSTIMLLLEKFKLMQERLRTHMSHTDELYQMALKINERLCELEKPKESVSKGVQTNNHQLNSHETRYTTNFNKAAIQCYDRMYKNEILMDKSHIPVQNCIKNKIPYREGFSHARGVKQRRKIHQNRIVKKPLITYPVFGCRKRKKSLKFKMKNCENMNKTCFNSDSILTLKNEEKMENDKKSLQFYTNGFNSDNLNQQLSSIQKTFHIPSSYIDEPYNAAKSVLHMLQSTKGDNIKEIAKHTEKNPSSLYHYHSNSFPMNLNIFNSMENGIINSCNIENLKSIQQSTPKVTLLSSQESILQKQPVLFSLPQAALSNIVSPSKSDKCGDIIRKEIMSPSYYESSKRLISNLSQPILISNNYGVNINDTLNSSACDNIGNKTYIDLYLNSSMNIPSLKCGSTSNLNIAHNSDSGINNSAEEYKKRGRAKFKNKIALFRNLGHHRKLHNSVPVLPINFTSNQLDIYPSSPKKRTVAPQPYVDFSISNSYLNLNATQSITNPFNNIEHKQSDPLVNSRGIKSFRCHLCSKVFGTTHGRIVHFSIMHKLGPGFNTNPYMIKDRILKSNVLKSKNAMNPEQTESRLIIPLPKIENLTKDIDISSLKLRIEPPSSKV